MVGVPFLVRRWLSGPSARIGWPSRCFARSQRMRRGPSQNEIRRAVITAPPERKVR